MTNIWHDISPKRISPDEFIACIEIPKGGKNKYEMDKEIINNAIEKALISMEKEGIKGKDATPYLLKTIVEITNGDSLESNIKLILNNENYGVAKGWNQGIEISKGEKHEAMQELQANNR